MQEHSLTRPTITAVILAKNESTMIANCLDTLSWCDEVLVLDTGSEDGTPEIATRMGARVVTYISNSFAQVRTKAQKYVKTDWLFFVDADERVTPQLSQEIMVHVETTAAVALRFRRRNTCYGKELKFGGWEDDWVTRVFRVSQLKGWFGEIHESPQFAGEVISLHESLLHFTHRDVVSSLYKSASWTPIEAKLLFESKIPPVSPQLLLRKGVAEVVRRLIVKKGYKDGIVGWIEALTQGINRVLVYMQVWELQQKPSLADQYLAAEKEVVAQWSAYTKKR